MAANTSPSATAKPDLFKLIELGDCAGVLDYAQRLFWWGERNKQNNWLNLGFDGGFTGPLLPHFQLGWTPHAVFAPGGTDDRDPYLYETLVKIVASVNATSQRAGVDPSTPAPAPSPIASITVQTANGWFDISIADPSDSRPGLFYFAESDVTPAFSAPRVYFMGASRNLYVQLGNQTLFWRAYSQYIGSQPSAPIIFGSPPIAVVGGGSSNPAPLPSAGSGVFPNGVLRGANGFGVNPGSRILRQNIL